MTDQRPASGLLFLHAQTALHPGSGTALGTVDLPVQRERHTQWPVVPGSSLKGILRDACRSAAASRNGGKLDDADADEDLVAAFGPPTNASHEHAGALSITDARPLAFPVRSLRGVFAWVTCPTLLDRLNRDAALAGIAQVSEIPKLAKGEVDQLACADGSPLLVDGNRVVLEEFEFVREGSADAAAAWIADHATEDAATQARIRSHLVVLHDDDFTHFVRHATEVVARIELDYETKTVSGGALFYQEFLPAECLFYSVVLAAPSRRNGKGSSPSEILGYVQGNLPEVLQVGGNETTGKGLCLTRFEGGGR